MPLHRRRFQSDGAEGELYTARAMHVAVPQVSHPEPGLGGRVAFNIVNDELMLDGNARQNLATFCQTWFDAEVHKLMDLSFDKNMIDKDEYPATAALEDRCVHIIADLWNSPAAATRSGAPAG